MTRRHVVGAGLAGAAALALPAPVAALGRRAAPLARTATFPSGVASGLPTERGITLWTQADGLERTSRLVVEIARDPEFRRVVRRQGVLATPEHGYTAKSRRLGEGAPPRRGVLLPLRLSGRRRAPSAASAPRGPPTRMEALRIGFFSCQLFTEGFYTAHRGAGAGGLRRHRLPGRLHVRAQRQRRSRRTRRRRARAASASCSTSTGRSTACTAADPDAPGDARLALRSWRRGTTTRSRTTTRATNAGTTASRRISYEERRRNAYAAWFEQMPTERFASDADRHLPPRPPRRPRRRVHARPAPAPRRPGVRRPARRSVPGEP